MEATPFSSMLAFQVSWSQEIHVLLARPVVVSSPSNTLYKTRLTENEQDLQGGVSCCADSQCCGPQYCIPKDASITLYLTPSLTDIVTVQMLL